MKQLRCFILGMLSILIFIPVIDRLLELISLWIDAMKVKPKMKVLNGRKDAVIIREFLKSVPPIYDDMDDDYEDYEE